jgi:hypothetical protein
MPPAFATKSGTTVVPAAVRIGSASAVTAAFAPGDDPAADARRARRVDHARRGARREHVDAGAEELLRVDATTARMVERQLVAARWRARSSSATSSPPDRERAAGRRDADEASAGRREAGCERGADAP